MVRQRTLMLIATCAAGTLELPALLPIQSIQSYTAGWDGDGDGKGGDGGGSVETEFPLQG